MRLLTLVTGGARSGKSTFAESEIKKEGKNIIYIATAIPFDDEMKDRIKKHKVSRPSDWHTIEKYKDFKKLSDYSIFAKADSVLIDCITILITNLILEQNYDFNNISMEEINTIEKNIFKQIDELLEVISNKNSIIVTNEVGMGIVPDNKLARVFRDISGRVNQHIAKKADKVYLLVSGLPVLIKGQEND